MVRVTPPPPQLCPHASLKMSCVDVALCVAVCVDVWGPSASWEGGTQG